MHNDKLFEVVQRINDLTSTMSDAFEHILNVQLPDNKLQESFYLLNDIVEAYLSISGAIKLFSDETNIDKIEMAGYELKNNLEKLLSFYELQDRDSIENHYKLHLIPSYKRWKDEIDIALNKYSS